MIVLKKDMQKMIFETDKFYVKALEDILECLVIAENYEKAAEVRDLIKYEKISDPILKSIFQEHLIDKYKQC